MVKGVGAHHCLSLQPVGQSSGGDYDPQKQHAPAQGNVMGAASLHPFSWTLSALRVGTGEGPGWAEALLTTGVLLVAGREKYPAPAGTSGRSDLFDDPSYVNVQNIDKTRQAAAASTSATANGSTQRDLFDMSECNGGRSQGRGQAAVSLVMLPLLLFSLQSPSKMPCVCPRLCLWGCPLPRWWPPWRSS